MTDASISTVPTMNPELNATGQFSFLNRPMSSQYLESFQDSLFGSNMGLGLPGMGMGMGMGMMGMGMMGGYGLNNQYLNQYIQNMNTMADAQMDFTQRMSDRQTQLAFDQRGNQNVLSSSSVSLQGNLTRLKAYIQNNDMRNACSLYNQILSDMNGYVGEEYDANNNRISDKARALRCQIESYYQQVNGTSLVADINENGSGSFVSMISSWFGSKQPSAKEAISYMTGDSQQYGVFERIWRSLTSSDSKAELTQSTSY